MGQDLHIITVSKRIDDELHKTLESIIASHKFGALTSSINLKSWITHSDKTDGKLEELRTITNTLSTYCEVSTKYCKAKGVYHAMRTTLAEIKSGFIWFVNAGDRISIDSLAITTRVIYDIKNDPSSQIKAVSGFCLMNGNSSSFISPLAGEINGNAVLHTLPCHQATLIDKNLYDLKRMSQLGDEQKIIYNSMQNNQMMFVNSVISTFNYGGVSTSSSKITDTIKKINLLLKNKSYRKAISFAAKGAGKALGILGKNEYNKYVGINLIKQGAIAMSAKPKGGKFICKKWAKY